MSEYVPSIFHAPVDGAVVTTALQPGEPRPRGYRFLGWELNLDSRKLLTPQGSTVQLTKTEFGLLLAFLRQPRQVLSRERILDLTRAFADIYDRAIDVQILRLRRKIEFRPERPALLKTVRGAGYVFEADNVQPVH